MRGAQPNKDLIVLPSGGQGAHPKFSVVAIPNLASVNNIASDGVLTHKEYMQVSSQEAKLLRICQRDAVFSQRSLARVWNTQS
jgi:hypothetical protein